MKSTSPATPPFHGQTDPTSVLVWDPAEIHRWSELDALGGWGMAGCMAGTEAGSRAAVYQTREDQGIAGFFDFSSNALRRPADLGFGAFGRPVPLAEPISREVLLSDPALQDVFQRIQGRRWLPAAAQRALSSLVDPPPPFATLDEPLPDEDEDFLWVPARPGIGWGIEAVMRDAVAGHPRTWRDRLGFSERPRTEVHPPGSARLMDLVAPGSVGECKLAAGRSALVQLDDYLRLCRRDRTPWTGHLIVSDVYTVQLAEAVFERADVKLWVCGRTAAGHPRLAEVTRANPRALAH